jgi:predicted NBD/HSP70 family sugar kinase
MPGWDNFDARGWFQAKYSAPTWIDNDVNMLALGVARRLPADDTKNLLYIKVGGGIGAAILTSGNLYRGSSGAAGNIAHLPLMGSSELCVCGQTGCLVATAGGYKLATKAAALAQGGRSNWLSHRLKERGELAAADIADGVRAADPACIELVTTSARAVGEALSGLVSFLNPSLVVLGGSIGGSGEVFLAATREAVYRRALPLATRDLRIITDARGHLEGCSGVTALVLGQLFNETLPFWVDAGSPLGNPASLY